MFDELLGRAKINPAIMLGKPVIRGTRLTVKIILEKLAAGRTVEEVREDYPFWLTRLAVTQHQYAHLFPTRGRPAAVGRRSGDRVRTGWGSDLTS